MQVHSLILCFAFLLANDLVAQTLQPSRALEGSKPRPEVFDDALFRVIQNKQTQRLERDGALLTAGKLSQDLNETFYELKLPKPGSKGSPPSLVELYAKCNKSVLSIAEVRRCEGCGELHVNNLGTGFAISSDGVVLTNFHVIDSVDKSFQMVASTSDGTTYPITKVLATNRNDDIAAVRVQGSGFPALQLSQSNATGTRVAIISHPRGNQNYLSEGIVSRHFMMHGNPGTPSKHIMGVSAEFAVGSSGAPVLDRMGNVVGMVATTADLNGQIILRGCIPAQRLTKLFERSTQESVKKQTDPLALDRKCLHTTFAAIVDLVKQKGEMPLEEFNRRFQPLHACMLSAIQHCPDDPIATRYVEFFSKLRRQK